MKKIILLIICIFIHINTFNIAYGSGFAEEGKQYELFPVMDIVFALDVSLSTANVDERSQFADAVCDVISKIPINGSRVSVLAFVNKSYYFDYANDSYVESGSADYNIESIPVEFVSEEHRADYVNKVRVFLKTKVSENYFDGGKLQGTSIGTALIESQKLLNRKGNANVSSEIILFTDGINSRTGNQNYIELKQEEQILNSLKKDDVTQYRIHVIQLIDIRSNAIRTQGEEAVDLSVFTTASEGKLIANLSPNVLKERFNEVYEYIAYNLSMKLELQSEPDASGGHMLAGGILYVTGYLVNEKIIDNGGRLEQARWIDGESFSYQNYKGKLHIKKKDENNYTVFDLIVRDGCFEYNIELKEFGEYEYYLSVSTPRGEIYSDNANVTVERKVNPTGIEVYGTKDKYLQNGVQPIDVNVNVKLKGIAFEENQLNYLRYKAYLCFVPNGEAEQRAAMILSNQDLTSGNTSKHEIYFYQNVMIEYEGTYEYYVEVYYADSEPEAAVDDGGKVLFKSEPLSLTVVGSTVLIAVTLFTVLSVLLILIAIALFLTRIIRVTFIISVSTPETPNILVCRSVIKTSALVLLRPKLRLKDLFKYKALEVNHLIAKGQLIAEQQKALEDIKYILKRKNKRMPKIYLLEKKNCLLVKNLESIGRDTYEEKVAVKKCIVNADESLSIIIENTNAGTKKRYLISVIFLEYMTRQKRS